MRDGERRAVAILFWALIIAVSITSAMSVCHGSRIGDLEERMATFETVAPPERVSP